MQQLPSHAHEVPANGPAVVTQFLDVETPEMRSLYEKAKRDQWNASSDIDWDSGLAPDCGILPDGLIDIYGTPYWERMSAAERLQLNRHFSAWRISQLMYGEQFALMVCGQIANAVPGIDAKFFMATQVMDEARHSEVLARYLYEKVGVTYPLTSNLSDMFDRVLETPLWYLKTVGTQLVAETLAVSLFRMLADHSPDPLISQICRRILADESLLDVMVGTVLAETTTMGVRFHFVERRKLERSVTSVATPYGPVSVKVCSLDGIRRLAPEYEDCARLARRHEVPIQAVYAAARSAIPEE